MEFENELVLEEGTENVEEQTTEEVVEEVVTEPAKMYTQEEFDKALNEKLDTILPKKIARKEAKIRKEYEQKYRPYEELGNVVTAGTGIEDVTTAKDNLLDFYTKKGINIPQYEPNYSENDMRVLAMSEANEIIDAGFDEVVEEVDRLANIGFENMNPREKLIFTQLAEYRQQESRAKELASMGVSRDVLNSTEFKDFAKQFNDATPITTVYDLYSKATDNKTPPAKIGSLKSGNTQQEKTYYSPEDVDRLTPKDLDNPKIMAAIRESMLRW